MSSDKVNAKNPEGGFALFVVLSFILVTASIATPFLIGAKTQALISRNTLDAVRNKLILRSLIEIAGTRYFERYADRTVIPAVHVSCPTVSFDFQDHAGLIDLNAASPEVLAIGLESLGVSSLQAEKLAMEVIRFRSVSSGSQPDGDGGQPKNGYKNAQFENAMELLELAETAGVELPQLHEVFTVHSGTGTIDLVATQGRLLERLERLSAAERFFVVNDVRRTNAVTVAATIQLAPGERASAQAVMGSSPGSGLMRLLGPLSSSRSDEGAPNAAAPPSLECEAFFDPVMINAIKRLTS